MSGPITYRPSEKDPVKAFEVTRIIAGWAKGRPDIMLSRTKWKGCDDRRSLLLTEQLYGLLMNSDCVVWDRAIIDAALAGQDAFKGTILRKGLSPTRPERWLFDGQIFADEKSRAFLEVPGHAECDSVIVNHVAGTEPTQALDAMRQGFIPLEAMTGRHGISICLVFTPVIPKVTPGISDEDTLPYFRWLPPIWEGEEVHSMHLAVIAGLEFLRLPFVQSETQTVQSRQQRRADQRRGVPTREVRCVTLRRTEKRNGSPSTEFGESHREYNCRWLVGAHWRKRSEKWNRGEGPIFVTPYLKGPAEKDFKAPRSTVYLAKR